MWPSIHEALCSFPSLTILVQEAPLQILTWHIVLQPAQASCESDETQACPQSFLPGNQRDGHLPQSKGQRLRPSLEVGAEDMAHSGV